MTASPIDRPKVSGRGRLLIPVLVSGLVLGVLADSNATARADNIDVALLDAGPKVMHYLQNHGYKNVGVLPFRVAKAGQAPKFNVGDLNTNVASRLENTLVLLDDPDHPVGIIHDAARAATRGKRGATYLTSTGRRGLLGGEYSLPWGDARVTPDAFLTGDVKFSPDNRKATVIIKAFHGAEAEPVIVYQFVVKTDRTILADGGQSFHLSRRALQKRGVDADELAADDATEQEQQAASSPAPDASSPPTGTVKLTVLFDGSEVAQEPDAGNRGARKVRLVSRRGARSAGSSITAPTESNKVSLVIENNSPTETYAVVVKVNGKNTLFEEEEAPEKCRKWVLDPAQDGKPTRYVIEGFYTSETGENLKPFKVLSDEDSKAREGEFEAESLGLIEMVVFTKVSTPPAQMQISRKLSLRGLSRGAPRPGTLAEYQAQLRKKTRTRLVDGRLAPVVPKPPKRGLIVGDDGGQVAGGDLEKVDLDNLELKDSLIIRYYTPGGGSADNPPDTGDGN